MKTGSAGLDLIKEAEGFSPTAYLDANDGWTIGYGHLITASDSYLISQTISKDQGEVLLKEDVREAEVAVNSQVRVPLNQSQYDALVSLVYNIGSGQFSTSTVKVAINNKMSKEVISEAWKRWNKDDGVVMPGLVTRRQKEVDLYFGGDLKKK